MLNIRLEKATPASRRKSKSLVQRLQAKAYRLPAHVTNDEDWHRDEPNVKLSRAFAVVLGIHVVAIGGFMAFELFRHKDPQQAQAPRSAAPQEMERPAALAAASSARSAEPLVDDPANEGLRTHVVAPGESLRAIAARFEVDERALMEKNGIGAQRPLETGMKLVIPNRNIAAQHPDTVPAPELPDIPANPLDAVAAVPPPSAATATAAAPPDLPVRKAEPVIDAALKPNRDPKKASTPTLTVARDAGRASASVAALSRSEKKPAAAAPAAGRKTYTVVDGDTYYKIAKAHRVSVDALMKHNSVDPRKLRPGTKLVIPAR